MTIQTNQAVLTEVHRATESMVKVTFKVRLEGDTKQFTLTASVKEDDTLRFNTGSGVVNDGEFVDNVTYRRMLDLALEAYRIPKVMDTLRQHMYATSLLPVWVSKDHKSLTLREMSTPKLLNVLAKVKAGDAGYANRLNRQQLIEMYMDATRRGIHLQYTLSMLTERHVACKLKGGVAV